MSECSNVSALWLIWQRAETQGQVLAGQVKAKCSSLGTLDSCQHLTLSEASHWLTMKWETFTHGLLMTLDGDHFLFGNSVPGAGRPCETDATILFKHPFLELEHKMSAHKWHGWRCFTWFWHNQEGFFLFCQWFYHCKFYFKAHLEPQL